jgi:hypothetical protein
MPDWTYLDYEDVNTASAIEVDGDMVSMPWGIPIPSLVSFPASLETCHWTDGEVGMPEDHHCASEFGTGEELMRHKSVDHQKSTKRRMASAGQNSRPRKCNRINPSTGKPCNRHFSRTYDLTRHEAIHNPRKQKPHCVHCVGEKTFSRDDSLKRHIRVVCTFSPLSPSPSPC